MIEAQEGSAWVLHDLGRVLLHSDEIRQAASHFTEALALFRAQGNRQAIGACLSGLAGLVCASGRIERAMRLFGCVEALLERIGEELDPLDRADNERYVTILRTHSDTATFAAKWAEGRAMALEQAIAEALDVGSDIAWQD